MIRPPPFRAEHIGSLVRPPELLRARQQHAAGTLDRENLAAIENAAIGDAQAAGATSLMYLETEGTPWSEIR